MPFKKVGANKYRSPSGRTYTTKQVKAYYATGGFSTRPSRPSRPVRGSGVSRMKRK